MFMVLGLNCQNWSEVDDFSGVCLSVSLFVNTIISERLITGWRNLAVRWTVQKSCPTSNVKVKGQGHRGQKKRKCAAFCSGVALWGAVLVRHFFSEAVLGAR